MATGKRHAKRRRLAVFTVGSPLLPWLMLATCLSVAIAVATAGRPTKWMGAVSAAAALLGALALAGGFGVAGPRGLLWLGRRRRIAWADVLSVRHEHGRWVVATVRGDVGMPRLANAGAIVAEIRRRTKPTATPGDPPSAETLRGWLGLVEADRLLVPGARLMADVHRLRVLWLAGMGLVLLAALEMLLSIDALVGLPMVFGLLALSQRRFEPSAMPVLVDETGIECDTEVGERVTVPWEAVLAVLDWPAGFVIQTSERDISFPGISAEGQALRRAAEAYLAAREAAGGFVAGPGDAALSPAARLSGDEERGLSQAEVDGR